MAVFGHYPGKKGNDRMFALNSKVAVLVACALAMAIVIHFSVYMSIEAQNLTAAYPVK
jgi:hypothetical protein